jgi:hypothetical protein
MDAGEEVSRSFIVACCDSAELLEFGKEALDEVVRFVDVTIIVSVEFAVCLGQDHDLLTSLSEPGNDPPIGVESAICDEQIGIHVRQQVIGPDQIMGLSATQGEGNRIAHSINQSMNFGTQSGTGSPNGLAFASFFWTPALC